MTRLHLSHYDIPTKANRILNIFLIGLIIIILRIWHLSVFQYDQRLEESRKPQKKTIVEPAVRGTIRDRFNLPLAINRIQYQGGVLYSQLKEIPAIEWKKDESGKKIKVYKRKEYIKDLSKMIATELNMDEERIEDLIHSKASYYAHVPLIIKEELTEQEYYRLKMKELKWPGVHVRRIPKRHYPKMKSSGDAIGYMGAINQNEYEKILHELKALRMLLQNADEGVELDFPPGIENIQQARKRFKELESKAYSINDYIGKTGIEGMFEEQLRGYFGKKHFSADPKGNYIHELPGSIPPIPGQRVLLTLSSELQEFAEKLLCQNEFIRVSKKCTLDSNKISEIADKEPWIKGGAIIAMDPFSGEILALASYPRFDPNDFIASGNPDENSKKREHIHQWFEDENHIASIWNLQQPLERERFNDKSNEFSKEQRWLSWETYLDFILHEGTALRTAMRQITTVEDAIVIQRNAQELMTLFTGQKLYDIFNFLYSDENHIPYQTLSSEKLKILDSLYQTHTKRVKEIKKSLNPFLGNLVQNYDKVLCIDLCHVALPEERFSKELISEAGKNSLDHYRQTNGHFFTLMKWLKESAKELFHDKDFKQWRLNEEKTFLQNKRKEEQSIKAYPKPYLDYLDKEEERQFQTFWAENKFQLLLALVKGQLPQNSSIPNDYLQYFLEWHQELSKGAHPGIEWRNSYDHMKKALTHFASPIEIEYLKTFRSYSDLTKPLYGSYKRLRENKNPLEKHLAAAFYPAYGFGYGRSHAYRQSTIQGSIFKLVTGYEALIQRYKKINLAHPSYSDLNPLTITDSLFQSGSARYMGYFEDGKPIPQVYKGGRLPRSLAHQNIGKVGLVEAMGLSSNPYFSLLAGEALQHPEDLANAARQFSYGSKTGIDLPGEISGKIPSDLASNRTGLYATAIGQHSLVVTPLQTAVMLSAIVNGGKVLKPLIVKMTAGRHPSSGDDAICCPPDFPYKDNLSLVGLDFPLFISNSLQARKNLVHPFKTEIKNEIFMPPIIRKTLLNGLKASMEHTYQHSMASIVRLYKSQPKAVKDFSLLRHEIIGKTSTSESVEQIDLDLNEGTNIYTHVWLGSVSFKKDSEKTPKGFIIRDEWGTPELVVVVYLRYGSYGKETAPLAAQIVQKWREIKAQHAK